MVKRTIIVLCISAVFCFLSTLIFSAPEDAVTKTLDRMDSPSFTDEVIKEWLDRIELSVQYETHKKPTFYFQTIQPLYQSTDKIDTFFIQPRVSYQDTEVTYNAGLGYRRLLSNDLLLGINFFGDYQDKHHHGRAGIGFEALGQIVEARLNGYFGFTPKREVEQGASTTGFEKAADGTDLELGMPVPYLPWLKIYGSGFWYNFERFGDKYGWKGRLEARLSDAIALEFFTWDDNKGTREYGGRVRFNLLFDKWSDFVNVLKFSATPFPRENLAKKTLIPVERNFNIEVEKWVESATGGLSFEIHRGD